MSKAVIIEILVYVSAAFLIGLLLLKGTLQRLRSSKKKNTGFVRWFNGHQPHLLLFFLVLFLLCGIASTYYYSERFLPPPPAEPADEIVPLFNVTIIITGIAFFLTHILLFYFAFRFRTKPTRTARFIPGFLKLELVWTIIPALTFIFLFVWGQILWAEITDDPEGDEVIEIEVLGQQFGWKVRYPGQDQKFGRSAFRFISEENDMGIDEQDPHSQDDFIPVQMHIPKNRPVRLTLKSKDVIHSFFIPHFRIKMDAVPGMITKMDFTATASTQEMREKLNDPRFNYEVACAELCGRMHFAMKLILVVDEPGDFERWYMTQKSWLTQQAENNL